MKICVYVVFALLLISSQFGFSKDAPDSVRIVADDNYPPYIFRDENGDLQGIIVEEWKLWEQKTGIKANLIAMDWGKAIQYMTDGNADVLETVFYTEKRAKIFEFSKPYANLEVPVFFHNSLSGITDVKTLRGFHIGVKSGDECISILQQNGISTLKEYDSYEDIVKAASIGEVRVFCIDKPPAIYYLNKLNIAGEFKISFTLYNGQFHRAVKKGNSKLLAIVENGFAKISPQEIENIEKKWFGSSVFQTGYFRYFVYSFAIVGIIVLFLLMLNLILRRKVKEKTVQLEKTFSELLKSESKFRTIYETANEGICVTDRADVLTAVNKKFELMTGYTADELVGKPYSDLLLKTDITDYKERFFDRQSGFSTAYERRLCRKDGTTIWTLASVSPIFDAEKLPNGYFGMFTDITERKLAEDEIRKLYRGIEQSPTSIIVTDINGSIEYVNSKFEETTGYLFTEVVGKNPRILKSGDKKEEEYREMWETILSGNDWQGELHNRRKNGELYWESASISPIKNEKGEITHFIAIKEDVTEKKKMIADLIAAKESAEELNRLKSSFLANMSHELRTPLIGILGYAEILGSELSDPVHQQMVDRIYKGGKRLSETLSLILDLSRAESSKIEVVYRNINVAAVATQCINTFAVTALQKGLRYQAVMHDETITANLDERLFTSVLNNLIDNAIKYTEHGEIVIESGKTHSEEVSWVYVSVKDTGIGIAEDKIEVIFDEFRQVSEGFGRNFEGAGLGLTVAKKLTELMGGIIKAESKPGVGSTFTVYFPTTSQAHVENDKKTISPVKSDISTEEKELPLLLFVEDDVSGQDVVRLMLRGEYQIECANSAVSALQMIQETTYEGFLMDINLGQGMDGLQLTQEIKKLPKYANAPFIAVTAFAMRGDKEELLAGGCTHYISKPFARAELIALVNSAMEMRGERSE